MKALLCTRYGGPDDLEIHNLPDPRPGAGEALVRVKAAALNFFDTLIIAGKYQYKPQMPFSPSAELAGVVEAAGEGVTSVRPGDRVAAYVGSGAARDMIAVDASRLVRIPDGLDFDHAAGVCVTYGTTLHALKDRADLKPGETLAVLGEIYTDLDDWNNAESYLRKALALDPNNLLALRNQAYLYEQQGKYQQAIDALDLALARSCPCPPGHGAVRAQQL